MAAEPTHDDARSGHAHQIPVIAPRPEAVAEVSGVRHRDLLHLLDCAERLAAPARGRFWQPGGNMLVGAALAGVAAGIPLSGDRGFAPWVVPTYWAVVVLFAVVGSVFLLAASMMRAQQADSIAVVCTELRKILAPYEPERPALPSDEDG